MKELFTDLKLGFTMPIRVYKIDNTEYCEFTDVVGEIVTIDLTQAINGEFIK